MEVPQSWLCTASDAHATQCMSASCDIFYIPRSCVQVWLVSEQKQVPITDLWDENDRAFLVFARSMGTPPRHLDPAAC